MSTSNYEFLQFTATTELIAKNTIEIYKAEQWLAEKNFVLETLEVHGLNSRETVKQVEDKLKSIQNECTNQEERWKGRTRATQQQSSRRRDRIRSILRIPSQRRRRVEKEEHGKLLELQRTLEIQRQLVEKVIVFLGKINAESRTIENECAELRAKIQLLRRGNVQAKARIKSLWVKREEPGEEQKKRILEQEKTLSQKEKAVNALNVSRFTFCCISLQERLIASSDNI